MAAIIHRDIGNPLLIPEIVGLVIDDVYMLLDLLNYAHINTAIGTTFRGRSWNPSSLISMKIIRELSIFLKRPTDLPRIR